MDGATGFIHEFSRLEIWKQIHFPSPNNDLSYRLEKENMLSANALFLALEQIFLSIAISDTITTASDISISYTWCYGCQRANSIFLLTYLWIYVCIAAIALKVIYLLLAVIYVVYIGYTSLKKFIGILLINFHRKCDRSLKEIWRLVLWTYWVMLLNNFILCFAVIPQNFSMAFIK